MLKKISIIAFYAVSAFASHTAELNINDKDLEVSTKFDVGQFNEAVEPSTMYVGARFLNAEKSHSADKRSSIDPFYEVNFLMIRAIAKSGVSIGMGAKLNYTKDYSTLPLGLEAVYQIPAPNLVPMSLHISLYYAPQVLSFSNATGYLEYRAFYDFEIIKNASITIGYRNINTTYDQGVGTINYNSSAYFGFKINF